MIELDVHAHVVPVSDTRVVSQPGIAWDAAGNSLSVDGERIGLSDLFHPERLLEWMRLHTVRRALISIPPPLYRRQLGHEAALVWALAINDGLAAIASASAGRLGALFHLPLEHPGLCHELVERHAGQAEGFAVGAGGDAQAMLSDSCFDRLWSALDRRRGFVFIHPSRCCDARLKPFYLENLAGNPYETGIAAAHLVMAGVPARFPDIRFCLAHAGGVFPSICGRLEQGFATRRPGVPQDVEWPRQAARRFYADGIAHDAAALRLAQEVFGEDHIMFGSDWPFPMGIREPLGS